MTATCEQMLEIAWRAALAAGDAILAVYFTAFDVQQKTDKTPVTEADLASERVICAMLTDAFPDIPIASDLRSWSNPRACHLGPRASGPSTR
jgi:3'(2'), 5'-bisphosphate nucleotidase